MSELKLLVIDDEPNIRAGLRRGLEGQVDRIDEAVDGADGLARFEEGRHDIVITDLRMPGETGGLEVVRRIHDLRPDTKTIVITAYGTVASAVEAMRCGAFDFVTKPVDLNILRHHIGRAAEFFRIVEENRRLREQSVGSDGIAGVIGSCSATVEILRQIRQVARTEATVLIHGESGTGKELVARSLHQLSDRANGPFVCVNLGAIPDSLLESELFGHEEGAFTGARRQRVGRFEAANGGTIFLDEITEASARSQVDLLRVLEERKVRRLGGGGAIDLDVRVVSASNRDFDEIIASGQFREDLYYRLNVYPIRLPPLRERRDDIPLLVDHYLARFCEAHGRSPKHLSRDALHAMVHHPWPGNIRQLRNVVERLVIAVESEVIAPDDLPFGTSPGVAEGAGTLADAVEAAERRAISAALERCEYHRGRTAELLDISVRTLHYKMSRYGFH